MDESFEHREARYRRFKQKHPATGFARYLSERLYRGMSEGRPASTEGALNVALGGREAFWEAGAAKAKKLFAALMLAPGDKVIEYGCGSLRLGAHFIRFLEPGGYFGLDVIDGFYRLGAETIGAELMAAKAPELSTIDDAGLAAAEAFAADIVFSNLVCVHVHPDEIEAYFRDLARLTGKRGARLIFDAELSEQPVRYKFDGWARPLAFYRDSLPGLEQVRATVGRPQVKAGHEVRHVEFEFRRA